MLELTRVFCDRNAEIKDPFIPSTVIVQSFGIGQWLKIQLAEYEGISANVDCVLPANFLWRLYQTLSSDVTFLANSPYDRSLLVWRIMRLINDNPGLSGAIKTYLNPDRKSDLHLYQLANEITLLFDEYLMYRPDWILKWENGGMANRDTLLKRKNGNNGKRDNGKRGNVEYLRNWEKRGTLGERGKQ